MSVHPSGRLALLRLSDFWLATMSAGLISIHLTLAWRFSPPSELGMVLLFWGAIACLIWQRRQQLVLGSNWSATVVGCGIISLVLLRSVHITEYDAFLRIAPWLSIAGVGLVASGWSGLRQYWRELLIVSCLVPSADLVSGLVVDLSPLTARFAAYVLWYCGLPVTREGIYIHLPAGSLEVYPGCSGVDSILHLLGIAVIFLALFPMRWWKQAVVMAAAIALGFMVNGFRVALLAILVARPSRDAFDYWHIGDGSLIFSLISVSLLGGLYLLFIQRETDA